jgi:hypothetical protein
MLALISFLASAQILFFSTVGCLLLGLLLLEGMKHAERKESLTGRIVCASLSIFFGILGWIGFFVELNRYVNAGLHP